MKYKYTPYIFLFLLLLAATLIIGVRIGKKVEEKNKVTELALSLTPTKVISTPTPPQALAFETYIHTGCGLSFTIPAQLKAEKESTDEAILSDKKITSVNISCKRNTSAPSKTSDPVATSEVKLSNQTLVGTILKTDSGKEIITFTVRNPRNGKNITISLEVGLLPLFERTYEFST